ncbi:unnamed protein product [Clonostachys solani]|uniref:LITAF domain-containing protein n=1 Tax=Clonostachys solani TaxID=160281 RepID=A0A9N9Z8B5_9HYPO|nr:unnamed protein product [Clonostachys solani]
MSSQIAPDCATPPPSYAQVDRSKQAIDVEGSFIDQTQASRDKRLAPVNDGGFPEVVISSSDGTRRSNSAPMAHSNPSAVSINSTTKRNEAPSMMDQGDAFTVTPLHLLDDQADWVDYPFCRQRVETRVKYEASRQTHYAATGLFLTTLGGVVAPYAKNWRCHITHICTNCEKKVAHKKYGKEMVPLGTPEHLRQVSRFASGSPAPGSRQSTN